MYRIDAKPMYIVHKGDITWYLLWYKINDRAPTHYASQEGSTTDPCMRPTDTQPLKNDSSSAPSRWWGRGEFPAHYLLPFPSLPFVENDQRERLSGQGNEVYYYYYWTDERCDLPFTNSSFLWVCRFSIPITSYVMTDTLTLLLSFRRIELRSSSLVRLRLYLS